MTVRSPLGRNRYRLTVSLLRQNGIQASSSGFKSLCGKPEDTTLAPAGMFLGIYHVK